MHIHVPLVLVVSLYCWHRHITLCYSLKRTTTTMMTWIWTWIWTWMRATRKVTTATTKHPLRRRDLHRLPSTARYDNGQRISFEGNILGTSYLQYPVLVLHLAPPTN